MLASIILLTSFSSMAFEILLARMASNFTQNYVLSQSLTLSFFILGMGIGSFTFKFLKKKTTAMLIGLELLLFFIGLVSFFCVQAAQIYTNGLVWEHQSKVIFLLSVTQVFVFVIGALAGMELPFFIQIKETFANHKNNFGRILALSYLGSFTASYATVAILLPLVGLYNTFNCILILVLISCYLLASFNVPKKGFYLFCILFLVLINGVFFKFSNRLQQIYLKNYYYGTPVEKWFWQVSEFPDIERHSTPYQEVDVVPDLFSFHSHHNYFLYIDQKLQYASQHETIYHESMVHGAINLARREPKKVLVLGGGEGLVVRELLKYNSITSIDLVELDQTILNLAETNPLFVEHNQNALFDTRVHVHVADAYMWVKRTSDKFDAIFIDLPHPYSVELSRLYSMEFYSFVKSALTEDGFFIFDYPANHLLSDDLKYHPQASIGLIYDTLKTAGFNNTFTFGPKESFIFASLTEQKLSFEEERLFNKVSDLALSNLLELPELSVSALDPVQVNSVFRPFYLSE